MDLDMQAATLPFFAGLPDSGTWLHQYRPHPDFVLTIFNFILKLVYS